jgi:hypothetical protein
MRRLAQLVAALPLAFAGIVGLAQSGALLDTPACRKAIDALDAREAAAARDRSAAARASFEAARKQAAIACLGGADAAASVPRRPTAQPPVVGVPSAAASAAATTATRVPVPVPTPAPVARPTPPVTLGACDATGCWTSDGTRLQRAGPDMLLGPRGICTVSGAVVQCPQ